MQGGEAEDGKEAHESVGGKVEYTKVRGVQPRLSDQGGKATHEKDFATVTLFFSALSQTYDG